MKRIEFTSGDRTLAGVLFAPEETANPAVVFCHGAFEFKENWLDYAERLSERGFSCLAFDFAGHGESGGIPSTVEMDVWTEDVRSALDFLESLGFSRFGVVGWSSGATAAILAASEDPRIECGVMIDSTVKCAPSSVEKVVFSLLNLIGGLKKAVTGKPLVFSLVGELEKMTVAVDEEVNRHYKKDERVIAALSQAPFPGCLEAVWVDVLEDARKITVPFLVIHGEQDSLDLPAEAELLHEALGGEKGLYIIEGSGHAGHLDQKRNHIFGLMAEWFSRHLLG